MKTIFARLNNKLIKKNFINIIDFKSLVVILCINNQIYLKTKTKFYFFLLFILTFQNKLSFINVKEPILKQKILLVINYNTCLERKFCKLYNNIH